MAKHRRRRKAKTGKWCVKSGSRTISCHRLKRAAKKCAARKGGHVVKGHK